MSNLGISLHGRSGSQATSNYASSSRKGSIAIISSSSDDDDDTPLPFPEALPRSDFLAPDFDPATYLSALTERHQTLEDLRSDLRDRSRAISAELLELVNSNYTAFLSLGNDLKGGDEKVTDVKMSLLGFRRALEDMKSQVHSKGEEVEALNNELKEVRNDVEVGRKMIELDNILKDLEARLELDSLPPTTPKTPMTATLKSSVIDDANWFSESENEDVGEENEGMTCVGPVKLKGLIELLNKADKLVNQLGQDKPFVMKTKERRNRCRNTILLDLSNATKEAKRAGTAGQGRLLAYMGLYRVLGASFEAVKVLKSK